MVTLFENYERQEFFYFSCWIARRIRTEGQKGAGLEGCSSEEKSRPSEEKRRRQGAGELEEKGGNERMEQANRGRWKSRRGGQEIEEDEGTGLELEKKGGSRPVHVL
jgi:hypothetical protein